MARDFTSENTWSNNSNNQPTHKVVIETDMGNLTISLFTKNNQFHAQLAKALENKDMANFIRNKMTSAMLTKISEVVEIDSSAISLIEQANQAA